MKSWTLYHGTSGARAKRYLKEGMAPSGKGWHERPISLTPDKSVAWQYAKQQAAVPSIGLPSKKRKNPTMLAITIKESDFKKMGDIGKIRMQNIIKAIKENWFEYEWYFYIPPSRIRKVRYNG